MQVINGQHSMRYRAYVSFWLLTSVVILFLFVYWNEPLKRSVLSLIPLFKAFLFLIATVGLGTYLGSHLARTHGVWIRLPVAAGIGLGLNALLVFIAGIFGAFSKGLFCLWMITGLLLFVVAVLRASPEPLIRRPLTKLDVLSICIIALVILLSIPYVVAPQTSVDALSYHLLVPKIYLNAGRIVPLPFLAESNYPGLGEYNYLAILALTDEITCGSFHFLMALLVALLLTQMVSKIAPECSLLLAPAFFLSMPVVVAQFAWAWNDFFYTFFVLFSLYFLFGFHTERNERNLLAAGIMAGLAGWTKYTFVLFVPVLLCIVFIGIRKWQWKEKSLLWLFFPIVLLSVPWVVKNWVFTGNPFYPFLNAVFQSPYWPDASNQYFRETIQSYYIREWHWYTYLLYPFLLIHKARLADIHTGLLPILLLPFAFFSGNEESEKKGWRLMQLYLVAATAVWWMLRTGVRTAFPLLAIFFVVTSITLQQRWKDFTHRKLIAVPIVVCLVANFVLIRVNADYLSAPFRFFIGLERESDYLKRASPAQQTYDYLNSAKDVKNVLLISMHEPLYLKPPYFFSGRYDIPAITSLAGSSQSASEMAARLKQAGISHIALDLKKYNAENKAGLYGWSAAQRKSFESMIQTDARPVAKFGNQVVFDWKTQE